MRLSRRWTTFFFELHAWYAVNKKTANAISSLENSDPMTCLVEFVKAAASPAGPEPTIATLFPVRRAG